MSQAAGELPDSFIDRCLSVQNKMRDGPYFLQARLQYSMTELYFIHGKKLKA